MSDERDIRAEDGDDDTAAATRPSGKRSTRRVRPSDPPADNGNGGVAMLDRPSSPRKADKSAGKATSNPFKRILRFLREVIAELRKVIWPNRKQMVTYTAVVLVFVVFMVAFISGIDVVYVKAVDWLFG